MINGKLVIPLNDEESFEFTDMPAAGSSWSPDGSNIAFFTDDAIWAMPVSPKTAQPEGTAKKLMDVEYARPMNITWSPDSDKVAFERFDKENHGDIWSISVKDGTLTRITNDPVEKYLPSWSPDGKYIAYMKGYPSIWISPSDGGEPIEIINRINSRAQLFWSPDSKWIIYMMGATVFYKLRLARIDDGCMFEIIIPDEVGGYLSFSADRKNMLFYRSSIDYKSTLRAVSSSGGQSFELGKQLNLWPHGQVWSSDGRMMIAHGEDKEKNIVLWVIPFSGGKPKILDFKVPIDEKPIYVSVSPDAQKLAFTIKHEDQTEDLYVVPISLGDSKTGESATMVFKEWDRKSAYNVISAWSPDSSKLAVIHEENIWIAYADGSNPVQLTKNLRHRTWPVWSPDSSMIAYSVNSSIDNRMLYIVSESSDEEIKLAESCETYRWSGDGNEITLFSGELISSISLCNREIRHIVNLRKLGVDYTWVFEWSPDGDRLAIIGSSEERDKPEQIFIINIIEGKVMELAEDDSGSKYSLSWSPDGKWLSYNSDLFVKTRPESKIWEADFDEILT